MHTTLLKQLLTASAVFYTLANPVNAESTEHTTTHTTEHNPVTVLTLEQMPVEQRIALNQAKLSQQRRLFQQYFAQAYLTYPVIPAGMLEALAYVSSRWEHQLPLGEHHHHMPQTIGLFGLLDFLVSLI